MVGASHVRLGEDVPYRPEAWEAVERGELPEGDELAAGFFHLARVEERGAERDPHGRFLAASSCLDPLDPPLAARAAPPGPRGRAAAVPRRAVRGRTHARRGRPLALDEGRRARRGCAAQGARTRRTGGACGARGERARARAGPQAAPHRSELALRGDRRGGARARRSLDVLPHGGARPPGRRSRARGVRPAPAAAGGDAARGRCGGGPARQLPRRRGARPPRARARPPRAARRAAVRAALPLPSRRSAPEPRAARRDRLPLRHVARISRRPRLPCRDRASVPSLGLHARPSGRPGRGAARRDGRDPRRGALRGALRDGGEAAPARAPRLGGREGGRLLGPLAPGAVRRTERARLGPALFRPDRGGAGAGRNLPLGRRARGYRSGTLRAAPRLTWARWPSVYW